MSACWGEGGTSFVMLCVVGVYLNKMYEWNHTSSQTCVPEEPIGPLILIDMCVGNCIDEQTHDSYEPEAIGVMPLAIGVMPWAIDANIHLLVIGIQLADRACNWSLHRACSLSLRIEPASSHGFPWHHEPHLYGYNR